MENELKIINPKTSRFQGADWYKGDGTMADVAIVGCGATGSFLSLYLSRMECKLHLYDFDEVNEENFSGQFFKLNQNKQLKTEALKQNLIDFTGNQNIHTYGKYTEDSMNFDIVFSTLDTMSGRKLLFNKWKNNPSRILFVDSRNGLEMTECYSVIPGGEEEYEKTLFDDEDSTPPVCNLRNCTHMSAIAAGFMCTVFTNFMANYNTNSNIREVPKYLRVEIPFYTYECTT